MLGERGGRLVEHEERASSESALTISTICCCAVESLRTSVRGPKRDLADLVEQLARSGAPSRGCRPGRGVVGSRFTNTFSATVRSGQEVELLEDDRHARALRLDGVREETGSPSSSIVPPSGEYTPARTFIKRRLAGAVLAHDGVDLAGLALEPDAVEHLDAEEALPDVASSPTAAPSPMDLHPSAGRRGGEHGIDQPCALRAPSANVGSPSRRPLAAHGSVRCPRRRGRSNRDSPAGGRRARRRSGAASGAEPAGVARDDLGDAPAAEPQRLGALLLEADAGLGAGDLHVQVVLAARATPARPTSVPCAPESVRKTAVTASSVVTARR